MGTLVDSAAYQRAWRKKNPSKVRKYKNTWRRKHRKKACMLAKAWRKNNPRKQKRYCKWGHLQSRYKLSKAEWKRLYKKGCWLCGDPFVKDKTPHVDHCHITGDIRGLAHGNCNRILGLVKDDFRMLRKLSESLEAYETRQKTKL